jgi:hypothetical protein
MTYDIVSTLGSQSGIMRVCEVDRSSFCVSVQNCSELPGWIVAKKKKDLGGLMVVLLFDFHYSCDGSVLLH